MASTSTFRGNARPIWQADADSEDEESETSVAFMNSGKVALLVVIDATPDMFRPWGDTNESAFRTALKCCLSRWRSKIISNPRDLVGILLAGTEKENNSSGFPNLFLLQPLSVLKASMIEELYKMETSDDYDGFHERIGSSTRNDISRLFWLSSILFDDAKAGSFAKRIIYFTCEDNPPGSNRSLRNDSIQKFKDLGNVSLSVVSFRADFQYSNFYQSILPDKSDVVYPSDLNNLLKVVRIKEKAKRPTCRSSLVIAPGVSLAVGVYSLTRSALPPKKILVNQRNNEVVTKVVNVFRADTGVTVLKSEQTKVASVMGETIRVDQQEGVISDDSQQTGIFLLGFIPREKFDEFLSFRSDGYFIYPDEERVTGSTDLFATLLRRCSALDKVPLVKMKLTRSRNAKLACLIPSIKNSAGAISNSISVAPTAVGPPSGFYVFLIPFSDEIRTHELKPGRAASDHLVELMEKIIRKTSSQNYDIRTIQNPGLQYKYRQIERKALEGASAFEEDEDFMDFTEPNEEGMHNRVGKICEELNATSASESARKKLQSVPAAQPKKPINMAMEVKNRRVNKLTRAVIAEFLEAQGISTWKKTKPQVVEMMYEFFDSQGS